MAGAACKAIINDISNGVGRSLERILTMPAVRDKIGAELARSLIQRLADIDIAAYSGGPVPEGGQAGILLELQSHGVISDDVWAVLRRP